MKQPAAHAEARVRASRILAGWLVSGLFPDRELERVTVDAPLVRELVLGVVRHLRLLRWMAGRMVARPPPPAVEVTLLVGFFQVFFLRMPAYAAVSTAVEAAGAAGGQGASRLVNAVLRRALRERAGLEDALRNESWPVVLSHPDLLTTRWACLFGADAARWLCLWNNRRAGMAVRLHRTHGLPEWSADWRAAGLVERERRLFGETYGRLKQGVSPGTLPGRAGEGFTIQDPSTGMAVDALDVRPGQTVLDACAAPGGKTVHLAERLQGRGLLVAMDLHEDRLGRLRENLDRSGWSRFVLVRSGDAASSGEPLPGEPFDRILLDVPCSNTGVIRRRPDARWRFSLPRLQGLAGAQRRILDGAARRLRPGGRLVYSTCSLEPEENREGVDAWLRDHPDFRLLSARLLFPPLSDTDGAFVAVVERTPFGR